MHCPSVLKKERVMPEILRVRGRTPVWVERMLPFLSRYPDRAMAATLEAGFTSGFRIPCSLATIPPEAKNLLSALLHSVVVSDKLGKEV